MKSNTMHENINSHIQQFTMPTVSEWWESLRWVLLIFTILILFTLIGSFYSYERVLAEGHPWLPRKVCAGCPFCGMTRSFCAMSSGRWTEAAKLNRAGPVLYVAGWLWLAASLIFALERRRLKLRRRQIAFVLCMMSVTCMSFACNGSPDPPSWERVITTASATAQNQPPSPPTTNHLVVYIDTSASMAGYVSRDRQGQTVFSRTLQELRNFVNLVRPPLDVLVRRVDSSVGTPQPDGALSQASIEPGTYTGRETNLAGAIAEFGRSVAPVSAERTAEDEQPPPARFHILVTDGVQSSRQQNTSAGCVAGSDQICVRRQILRLLEQGWGGYVIGLRSEFQGRVYSEITGAAFPYESRSRDARSFRPFYLYVFSPDRRALDSFVGTLRERLRPMLGTNAEMMRTLALTSAYSERATEGEMQISGEAADYLEMSRAQETNPPRFTLRVSLDTEQRGAQPFTISVIVPWSEHARDGGTPQELAQLIRWELAPVSVANQAGEASDEQRQRSPEVRITNQEVDANGRVALRMTAQYPRGTGEPDWRAYRLTGRLNVEQQTPLWVQQWSTNLDTTADTGNRTLNLESALLGLWRNPQLENQTIAEMYLRVGPD